MALTKEEYQQRIQAIGACEDEAERLTLLADLSEDGSAIFDAFATAEAEKNAAQADIEKLREANMKLFLKIGDPSKPPKEDKPGAGERLKFEDLFNEKGGIK